MNPTYAVLVLYVKHTEACKQGMTLEAIDMIEAVCRVVNGRNGGNSEKVLGAQPGAQRLNNLWLLYLHDEMTRLDLYSKESWCYMNKEYLSSTKIHAQHMSMIMDMITKSVIDHKMTR